MDRTEEQQWGCAFRDSKGDLVSFSSFSGRYNTQENAISTVEYLNRKSSLQFGLAVVTRRTKTISDWEVVSE